MRTGNDTREFYSHLDLPEADLGRYEDRATWRRRVDLLHESHRAGRLPGPGGLVTESVQGERRRVSPYDHDDYRAFVAAWLEAADGRPSLRQFASWAKCSPALLSRILAGERRLEPSRVSAFAKALGLDQEELRLFTAMVDRQEAASLGARRRAAGELEVAKRFRTASGLTDRTCELFARWYLQAIAELARCEGFQASAPWIASTLRPSIGTEEAAAALDDLCALGLLVRDESGVSAAPADAWATLREVPKGDLAKALDRHHRWTVRRAEAALDGFDWEERNFSTMVLSLSPGARDRLRESLRRFQDEVVGIALSDTGTRDRVYTVAVQVFPLSERTAQSTSTESFGDPP